MHIEDIVAQFTQYFMLGLLLGGLLAYVHHQISGARLQRFIRKIMRRTGTGVFVRPYTVKISR